MKEDQGELGDRQKSDSQKTHRPDRIRRDNSKLALEFPDFVKYVESVCQEFRTLYDNMKGCVPYCIKKVAVLNC